MNYKAYENICCTGIEDVNRQSLFINDIVQYTLYDNPFIGVIKFGEYIQNGSGGEYEGVKCLGFYIERIKVVLRNWENKDDIFYRETDFQKTISILEAEDIQKLGDIYKNAELIE